jgi:hypothetical protein
MWTKSIIIEFTPALQVLLRPGNYGSFLVLAFVFAGSRLWP